MGILRKWKIAKIRKELNAISGLREVIQTSEWIPNMRYNFIASDNEPTFHLNVVNNEATIFIDTKTIFAMVRLYELYLNDIINNLEGGE